MDKPVLLTGAGGRVGQAILGHLGDRYHWRLLDREPLSSDKIPETVSDADVFVADVTDDYAVRNAVDAGVEKFAFASSNHAVGAYETTDRTPDMYRPHHEFRLDGTELPRPSNLYGVSKAAGEVLGRYYHDHHDLSVVNVRIGNLTEGHPPIDYERGQAMWLSGRDCAHLFDCCLTADYGYEIVYGISDNDRKYYSIDRAKAVLGYDPQDNSSEWDGDEHDA